MKDLKTLASITQELFEIIGDKYKLDHDDALEVMVNAVCTLVEMGGRVGVDRGDSIEDVVQMICSYVVKSKIEVKNLQIIKMIEEVWH